MKIVTIVTLVIILLIILVIMLGVYYAPYLVSKYYGFMWAYYADKTYWSPQLNVPVDVRLDSSRIDYMLLRSVPRYRISYVNKTGAFQGVNVLLYTPATDGTLRFLEALQLQRGHDPIQVLNLI